MPQPATAVPASGDWPKVKAQLLRLRRDATECTISRDLELARALVAQAGGLEREEADRLYLSLCQLERWLHDR